MSFSSPSILYSKQRYGHRSTSLTPITSAMLCYVMLCYLLELFCDRRLATGNDILRLVIREYMYLTLNKQQNTAMTNYHNGPQRIRLGWVLSSVWGHIDISLGTRLFFSVCPMSMLSTILPLPSAVTAVVRWLNKPKLLVN